MAQVVGLLNSGQSFDAQQEPAVVPLPPPDAAEPAEAADAPRDLGGEVRSAAVRLACSEMGSASLHASAPLHAAVHRPRVKAKSATVARTATAPAAATHPSDSVTFFHRISLVMNLGSKVALTRFIRHVYAMPIHIVFPSMIDTAQPVIFITAIEQ